MICEGCGQEGADKRCSGCMESWYCSIACQRQHWKAGHKHKCFKAETPSAATAAATPLPTASGGAAQGSQHLPYLARKDPHLPHARAAALCRAQDHGDGRERRDQYRQGDP